VICTSVVDLNRCLEEVARYIVRGDIRPGLIEAFNTIAYYLSTEERRRRFLIIDMPTGYGKSTLSIVLAKALSLCGELRRYAERVIHIVPTRSLAYDLIFRARRAGVEAYGQYMGLDPALKSASFLAGLVFTTVDSYVLNLFKTPVIELKDLIRTYLAEEEFYGHFELPRYAVFTGLSIFDEYHLMIPLELGEPSKQTTVFLATLSILASYGAPAILESATGIHILERLLNQRGLSIFKFELQPQHDRDFFASRALQSIKTDIKVLGGGRSFTKEVVEIGADLAKSFKRVGVVVNTVETAVTVYELLKERTESNVVLLHSRFRYIDIEEKLNFIESAVRSWRPIVVVATQVIEVGLDLDFDAMITEVAPMPSLVQRVGRLCRDPKKICEADLHIVVDGDLLKKGDKVYTVYDAEIVKQTYEAIRDVLSRGLSIQWKVPISSESSRSYRELIDEVHRRLNLDPNKLVDRNLERKLLNLGSRYVFTSRDVLNLLKEVGGSLVRDETLVTVYLATSCREEEVPQHELDEYSLSVELGVLLRRGAFRRDLLCVESGRVLVIVSPLRSSEVRLMWINGSKLLEGLEENLGVIEVDGEVYVVNYLVGKREKYNEEWGFV